MSERSPRTRCARRHWQGFTLVEVILVVAVIAVLITLAAPSYRDFLSRAHRTDAIAELLQAAACQERTRAVHGRYDTDRCLPAPNDRYRFAYSATETPRYFRIEASPLGAQQEDPCGTLVLDALGRRSAAHPGPTASACWSGR